MTDKTIELVKEHDLNNEHVKVFKLDNATIEDIWEDIGIDMDVPIIRMDNPQPCTRLMTTLRFWTGVTDGYIVQVDVVGKNPVYYFQTHPYYTAISHDIYSTVNMVVMVGMDILDFPMIRELDRTSEALLEQSHSVATVLLEGKEAVVKLGRLSGKRVIIPDSMTEQWNDFAIRRECALREKLLKSDDVLVLRKDRKNIGSIPMRDLDFEVVDYSSVRDETFKIKFNTVPDLLKDKISNSGLATLQSAPNTAGEYRIVRR